MAKYVNTKQYSHAHILFYFIYFKTISIGSCIFSFIAFYETTHKPIKHLIAFSSYSFIAATHT